MAGFVYIWHDRLRNRFYIGSHWGTADDGYVCSSPWMKRAYNRRPQDFRRRIIKWVDDRGELLAEEERLLQMIRPEEIGVKYYNLKTTTAHWSSYPENIETIREKISLKTREAMADPTIRAKYEEGIRNRRNGHSDPEVRKRKSEAMKRRMAEKFPIENRKDPRNVNGSRSRVRDLP